MFPVAALLTLAWATSTTSAATNIAAKTASAAPPEPEVPQSIFIVPAAPQQGRDPFFPRSTRPYAAMPAPVTPAKTNVPAPPPALELVCNGISGTPEKPLAIINFRTFEIGEENEVSSGGRSVRIRCLEINRAAGTVLIQAGGERRELRLQPRK